MRKVKVQKLNLQAIPLTCLFVLALSFTFSNTIAQTGYISIGGKTMAGVQIVDMGSLQNCLFCYVRSKDSTVKYSPNESDRYGINEGAQYVAYDIKVGNEKERVFLELVQDGKLKLFCFTGRGENQYYIGRNDTVLTQLLDSRGKAGEEPGYKETLLSFTADFPQMKNMLSNVGFRKQSLKELIKRYNQGKAIFFPSITYGIVVEGGFGKIIPTSSTDPVLYGMMHGFSLAPVTAAGAFADIPVHFSPFSVHPEIQYRFFKGYSNNINLPSNYDINLKVYSLNFPLLIRYTYPAFRWQPYMEAGPEINHYFSTKGTVFEAVQNGNGITEKIYSEPYLLKANQESLLAGAGIRYVLSGKGSLFLEVRYRRTLTQTNSTTMVFEAFSISTGIHF